MANYLYVVADRRDIDKLVPLFRAEESSRVDITSTWSALYVSAGGRMSADGGAFKGWAVDYPSRRVIFPSADPTEWPTAPDHAEGSFFRAERSGEGVRVCADEFAVSPLLHTSARGLFAASDSLFVLTIVRRALGHPTDPHPAALESRRWTNSMGQQQFGPGTVVAGIDYAFPGTVVTRDLRTGRTTIEHARLPQTLLDGIGSHEEAVTESARRMVQLFRALATAGVTINAAISGGMDSRVVLAAALTADIGERLAIGCQDNGSPDLEIATRLADRFRFPLNRGQRALQGRLQNNDQLAYWAVNSMGFYDALYAPRKLRRVEHPVFQVGGHGAEAAKGNYGWRPISAIGMPESAKEEATRALSLVGVDATGPEASEWHFLMFRNAIHSSRGAGNSEYAARPAVQKPAIGLSRSPLCDFVRPLGTAPNVVQDVLIALSPDLAMADFDKPRKNLRFAHVSARSIRNGGPLAPQSIPDLSVAGSPEPNPGLTRSFLDLARDVGLSGPTNGKTLTRVLQERPLGSARMLLDDELRAWLTELDPDGATTVGASTHAGVAAGKALMDLLFL
ncbi:hypothetical protein [Brachybacterium saurashtrense]|uniref:Asparagine synthetase domain-containing protein n=1 Tax=Brachybacterium saurashtrense TaxID=556288 RepID=A0A345YQJ5_9MICO|nr:hypothetical protein [Brachybacterium saurashtrense]AXK46197.1 hypothetical protein DWV08_11645 [Brachybacterium saurashtrense]RRR23937.1 hypothetical protein DXU92_03395 [Brachybacterium saurashtrense]